MNKKVTILIATLTLLAGSTAFAQPIWRGEENSTYQEWGFGTNDPTPDEPDDWWNPYGVPELRVTPVPGGDWIPDPGAWPLSGEIDIRIPNHDEEWPEKEIYIGLRWQPTDVDPLLPNAPIIGVYAENMDGMIIYPEPPIDEGDWWYSEYVIEMWPNPPEEWITIKGDILVDQIVIDTICIPEPATVVVLGLGGLMALTWRRKRY